MTSRPHDGRLVRTKVLIDGASLKFRGSMVEFNVPEESNHRSVVNAIHPRRGKRGSLSICGHFLTHCANPLVASNTAAKQQLGFSCVRHRPLGDFHAGSKSMLLKRPAHGVQGCSVVNEALCCSQQARKSKIHSSNSVRKLQSFHAWFRRSFQVLIRKLFNFGPSGEGNALIPCKFIKHIADADIQGFPKYTISALQSSDNLGVSSRDVQENGVVASALLASDFNVGHAMVDTNKGDVHLGC